ncbi:MAG TPA: ABC transporter substrate-binding protein [Nitrospiraceae bacterium]|nr:ABC transporter substrate-binding protein [Nitrospiraceae bacterium]
MNDVTNNVSTHVPRDFSSAICRTLVILAALVALFGPSGTGLASAESTPTESVKRTIADVVRILDNTELKQPTSAIERRRQIEHVVKDRVSYEEMAKRSLGQPWTELTKTQQKEFVALFVQLLRDTFAGRIDDYTGEQVVYLSEQREGQFAEVKTQLTGDKVDTLLDFRLANRQGTWLVYDVVIDGASIVGNYHAQFTSLIRDLTYQGLVEKMKEKTLVAKAFEMTPAP